MKKRYSIDGRIYEIPETEVAAFLQDNPKAQEVKFYSVNGKNYNIPIGETDAFENDMGLKKKESALSSIGSAIGSIFPNGGKVGTSKVQSPDAITITPEEQANIDKAKEQPFVVDEKDPIKSFNNAILAQTIQFKPSGIESTGQKFLSPIQERELSKTENLNKILPSQSAKLYEQVKASAFPNTKDAVEWLQNNPASQTPDNETAKLANQKIERRKTIDELAATSPTIEDMVSKLAGKNISDMSPVEAGRTINNFLNQPEVIEKADEGGKFLHDYNVAKGTLLNNHPAYGLQKVATELSQKLEDEKMTGWLYSNPGVEKTDKAIQMLSDEGKLTEAEKNIYNQALRPIIEAGGSDQILKTSDLAHAFGRGIYSGVMGIGASARDISNKVTGGVFQNLGLLETDEDRTKRLQEEQAAQTELIPRKGRKGLVSIGEFTGFTVPMILGNMAKVPQALNAVLMFEGNRADKSRELFPEDKGKQSLYTLLGTTMDAALMSALPTKKAGEGVKNLFEKDILNTIDELSTKKITEETAKNNLLEKFQSYIGDVAKGNIHTANVLTAFQMANNGLDAAFGKRDFNLENEISDALKEYKTNFLIGTPLSMLGAIPKSEQMNSNGRVLREMADNPDLVRDKIKDDPDKQRNLEKAILINDYLKERPDLSEERKNRFMGEAMRESALNEKEKATTVPILKEPIKKEIKESQISQQIILDPEMGNKKIVQEFFDNDLLPKGSRMLLSDENGKFSEYKVGAYLKYLAQQENNLDENWHPESKEKISKATEEVPEQLKEIANERWKDEIEKAKSTEEKVTPQEEPISTPTVDEFVDRIKNGEKMESPEDLQFYENNKKEIEDKLKQSTPTVSEKENVVSGEEKKVSVITPEENKVADVIPLKKTEPQLETPLIENKPPEPPIEGEKPKLAHIEYPPTSLNYMGTGKLETEFGLEPRTPTERKRDVYTIKEANDLIDKGIDINSLISRTISGEHTLSDAEYVVLTKYGAELSDRLRKQETNSIEYNRTLSELNRAAQAANTSGQGGGRALGIRARFKTIPEGSFGEFMLQELAANNDAPLTDAQKKTAEKEYDNFSEKKKEYEDKITKLEEDNTRLKAERELAKQQKTVKRNKNKSHDDFINERKSYIEELKEAKKKHEEWLKEQGIQKMGGGFVLTGDMVKAIGKIIKSYAEEAGYKLEEMVSKVYDDVKDVLVGISKKDIHDVIAGEYNERKMTKTDAAIRMENLRIEAQLLNKLERLIKGEEPKKEKQKRKRTQEIEDLRKQIEQFRKDEAESSKFYKETKDEQYKKLEALKNKNEKETAEIKEKIKSGDLSEKEKTIPLLQNKELKEKYPNTFKEAQQSADELIKAKREIALRRLKQAYENKTPQEKTIEVFSKTLNIPRTLMASFDFSAPLRQGIVASTAHPIFASQALKFMFESAKDEKVYNRWLDDVHKSERWQVAEKTKLSITDPESLHVKEREEAFFGAPYAEKIPIIGEGVKASERAYVGYLNHIRWNLFNMYADQFEATGKTYENNPKLYEGISSFINSATGRGGTKGLENAAPILNWFLFASRLIASRLNMLGLSDVPNLGVKTANLAVRAATLGKINPKWSLDYGFYSKLPKEIRIEAAKDMLKFVAVGASILILAKQLGAEVELDPRSSDFGKVKVGNTRWDIWGGFQPYARVVTQVVTGQRKTTTTGEVFDLNGNGFMGQTRLSPFFSFARQKLAPVPGAILDLVPPGRDAIGQPVTVSSKLVSLVTPLLIQDVIQGMKDQGVKALFTVGVPSAFGVGVQTYFPREKKTSTIPKPKQPTKPSKF